MAISFRSYASNSQNNGSPLNISKPTGTVNGDLMIALIGSDRAVQYDVISAPVGWTQIDQGGVATTMSVASFYKIASSEGSDYDFTFSYADDATAGYIITIQKDSGTWEAPNQAGYHSIAEVDTAASITTGAVTTIDGDVLLCGYFNDGGQGITGHPAGMTITIEETPAQFSGVAYYEESLSAGSPTRQITYQSADQAMALAVVCSIGAVGGVAPTGVLYGPLMGPMGGPI